MIPKAGNNVVKYSYIAGGKQMVYSIWQILSGHRHFPVKICLLYLTAISPLRLFLRRQYRI